MGLSSGKPSDAGHRADARGATHLGTAAARLGRGLLAACLIALPGLGQAEALRLATFAAPLSRAGPGLLLRDILQAEDEGIAATLAVIVATAPDVILLTDFDHDAGGAARAAFQAALAQAGLDLPHGISLRPNAGVPSGFDLDRNGRMGEARDALGYGRFPGEGGLTLLSRWPIGEVTEFTGLLWRDLPGARLPMTAEGPFFAPEVLAVLPLSSTAQAAVEVLAPGGPVTLMVWSGTPPVFDGPEDANGLRAADEARLWQVWLDGGLEAPPPPASAFVLMGTSNLDPVDGEGPAGAMAAILSDPRWQDPGPASPGAALGDPAQAQDTADWPEDGPGNLRVSYILPSADWTVTGAGVFWPAPDAPEAAILGEDGLAAGPHRLVWTDLRR